MKYTRYNYKKNNNRGFKSIIFLITVIILAVILGTSLSKIIFRGDTSIIDVINSAKNIGNKNKSSSEGKLQGSFEFIQCGYYSDEKNAIELQNQLANTIPVYILQEGDKYRVVSGIYSLDKGNEDKDKLINLGINAIRTKIEIQGSSYYDSLISGLVDGYVKILEGLKTSGVKSVNTDGFKTWAATFQEKDGKANEIKSIKEHINNLPTELNKNDISKELVFLYTIIEPYKAK